MNRLRRQLQFLAAWLRQMYYLPIVAVLAVAGVGVAGYLLPADSGGQRALYQVILSSGIVGALAFIAYYTKVARWWRNPVGRTLVALDVCLIAAMCPTTYGLFFGFTALTERVAQGVDAGVFGLIPLIMAHRIWIWYELHHASLGSGDAGMATPARQVDRITELKARIRELEEENARLQGSNHDGR